MLADCCNTLLGVATKHHYFKRSIGIKVQFFKETLPVKTKQNQDLCIL